MQPRAIPVATAARTQASFATGRVPGRAASNRLTLELGGSTANCRRKPTEAQHSTCPIALDQRRFCVRQPHARVQGTRTPYSADDPEKSLALARIWAWISRPMHVSQTGALVEVTS